MDISAPTELKAALYVIHTYGYVSHVHGIFIIAVFASFSTFSMVTLAFPGRYPPEL